MCSIYTGYFSCRHKYGHGVTRGVQVVHLHPIHTPVHPPLTCVVLLFTGLAYQGDNSLYALFTTVTLPQPVTSMPVHVHMWNSTYYTINNYYLQSEMLLLAFMRPPVHSAVMHFQSLAPSQNYLEMPLCRQTKLRRTK